MSKFFYSIIVPVYNVEKYLEQCLESILSQSFNDYEMILVDDGSTDSSGLICDKYASNYSSIKVIHKQNGGSSDARNTGIDHHSGKYILFIDSDDFIESNSLENIHKEAIKHKKLDVMFLGMCQFYEKQEKKVSLNVGHDKTELVGKDKSYILKYIASLPKFPGSAWGILISSEMIRRENLRFIQGITNEDLYWSLELFLIADNFAYCDSKYYNYRVGRVGSITNVFEEDKFVCLLEYVEKYCDLENEFSDEIQKMIAFQFPILLLLYSRLDNDRKKIYKKRIESRKYLMNVRNNKRDALVKYVYSCLGLDITAYLLQIYLKVR